MKPEFVKPEAMLFRWCPNPARPLAVLREWARQRAKVHVCLKDGTDITGTLTAVSTSWHDGVGDLILETPGRPPTLIRGSRVAMVIKLGP